MRAWSSGRRMMDLVSFSEEGAIHDWNYLLGWWMATAKKPANG